MQLRRSIGIRMEMRQRPSITKLLHPDLRFTLRKWNRRRPRRMRRRQLLQRRQLHNLLYEKQSESRHPPHHSLIHPHPSRSSLRLSFHLTYLQHSNFHPDQHFDLQKANEENLKAGKFDQAFIVSTTAFV